MSTNIRRNETVAPGAAVEPVDAPEAPAVASRTLGNEVRAKQPFRWRSIPVYVYFFGAVLILISLAAIFAPLVAPHDPLAQSLRARLDPPFWIEGGSTDFLLGTDRLGRDILSRIIYGARTSLAIGLVALVIGSALGTLAGLVAGYAGGWLDEIVMTVVDIQLAFPFVLLAIALVAVLGTSLGVLIVVVGLSGWVTYARIARARVLSLRETGFIEAIESVGATRGRILARHVLPNTFSPLIVLATLELSRLIILEATLSFLGLGVQPPTPSWGGMIGDGREYLGSTEGWWISIMPGIVLFVTALGISRLGDWTRDRLDPTMRHN